MAELTWTAEAERWLRDIYDYIALEIPELTGFASGNRIDSTNAANARKEKRL